ncbi:hypothetical protein JDS77_29185 [Bacillus cereus group sp. N28]|uniref:hypothetical protein n=1 Tax=Bacillus cereus group sp. N28 TaxID=2794593 RepID=UPI0018F3151A|nr:hypothetical protein [Bacillus cereus group sp. N28]MBJ7961678.1 hypothetical protein [Bacillus cereus group sp. N28]
MKYDIKNLVEERIKHVELAKKQYEVNVKTSEATMESVAQAKAEGGLWATQEELSYLRKLLEAIENNEK